MIARARTAARPLATRSLGLEHDRCVAVERDGADAERAEDEEDAEHRLHAGRREVGAEEEPCADVLGARDVQLVRPSAPIGPPGGPSPRSICASSSAPARMLVATSTSGSNGSLSVDAAASSTGSIVTNDASSVVAQQEDVVPAVDGRRDLAVAEHVREQLARDPDEVTAVARCSN